MDGQNFDSCLFNCWNRDPLRLPWQAITILLTLIVLDSSIGLTKYSLDPLSRSTVGSLVIVLGSLQLRFELDHIWLQSS